MINCPICDGFGCLMCMYTGKIENPYEEKPQPQEEEPKEEPEKWTITLDELGKPTENPDHLL